MSSGDPRLRNISIGLVGVARFSSCLFVMISAGIGLVRALDIIAESDPDGNVCLAADSLARYVESGQSLSGALSKLNSSFDKVYVRMIFAGESSGNLTAVLSGLAKDADRLHRQRSAVKQALIYPFAVFSLSMLMVGFMIFYMLPRFLEFFEGLGTDLPLITKVLIFVVYNPLVKYPVLIGLLLFAGVAYYLSQNDHQARAGREFVKYKTPIIGRVNLLFAVSNFCHHLSLLGDSGVGLMEALKILSQGSGNEELNRSIERTRRKIKDGYGFSEAMSEESVFPPLLVHTVAASEEGGNLYQGVERASKLLGEEAEQRLNEVLPLLEPLLMGFMGGIVGFIVLATFLPIYQLATVQL